MRTPALLGIALAFTCIDFAAAASGPLAHVGRTMISASRLDIEPVRAKKRSKRSRVNASTTARVTTVAAAPALPNYDATKICNLVAGGDPRAGC